MGLDFILLFVMLASAPITQYYVAYSKLNPGVDAPIIFGNPIYRAGMWLVSTLFLISIVCLLFVNWKLALLGYGLLMVGAVIKGLIRR